MDQSDKKEKCKLLFCVKLDYICLYLFMYTLMFFSHLPAASQIVI